MKSNEYLFYASQTNSAFNSTINLSINSSINSSTNSSTVDLTILCHQSALLEGINVLLVEDELDIAELLIVILEGIGANVVWAALAKEALDLLEKFQPDILICNIKLPDRNGDWLIQQIRAKELGQSRHLPAIAVTSYSRDVTAAPMLLAGFDCFLSKLQDPNEFISTVVRLLQQSSNSVH